MASPSAMAKLSEALSLLSEVVENSDAEAKIARNLAMVYAAKAAGSAVAVLGKPGQTSPAELHHWEELLLEFGRGGVESEPVAAVLSQLNKRLASRYVAQLTQLEKEVLLRHLEADLGKET